MITCVCSRHVFGLVCQIYIVCVCVCVSEVVWQSAGLQRKTREVVTRRGAVLAGHNRTPPVSAYSPVQQTKRLGQTHICRTHMRAHTHPPTQSDTHRLSHKLTSWRLLLPTPFPPHSGLIHTSPFYNTPLQSRIFIGPHTSRYYDASHFYANVKMK